MAVLKKNAPTRTIRSLVLGPSPPLTPSPTPAPAPQSHSHSHSHSQSKSQSSRQKTHQHSASMPASVASVSSGSGYRLMIVPEWPSGDSATPSSAPPKHSAAQSGYPTPDSSHRQVQSAGSSHALLSSSSQPLELHLLQKVDHDNLPGSGATNPSARPATPSNQISNSNPNSTATATTTSATSVAPSTSTPPTTSQISVPIIAASDRRQKSSSRLSRHLYNRSNVTEQENSPPPSETYSRPSSSLQKPLSKPKQVLQSLFGGRNTRSSSSELPSPKTATFRGKPVSKTLRVTPGTPSNPLNERYHASTSSLGYFPTLDQPGIDAGLTGHNPTPTTDSNGHSHPYRQQQDLQPQYQQHQQQHQSPNNYDNRTPLALSHQYTSDSAAENGNSRQSSVYSQLQTFLVEEEDSQTQEEFFDPDSDDQLHPGYTDPSIEVAEQHIIYKPLSSLLPPLISPRLSSLPDRTDPHGIAHTQQSLNQASATDIAKLAPLPPLPTLPVALQSYSIPPPIQGQNSTQGALQQTTPASNPAGSPKYLVPSAHPSKNFSLPLSFNSPPDHQDTNMTKYSSQHDAGQQPAELPIHQANQSQASLTIYGNQSQTTMAEGPYGFHTPNSQQVLPYDSTDQNPQQVGHAPSSHERSNSRQEIGPFRSEADYEALRAKYNKLVTKHNHLKKMNTEGIEKVIALENALASHNMSLNRMLVDDQRYSEGFLQVSKNISQLAHLIRKSWKDVPMFLFPFVNHDAIATGGREMIAVGRSFISAFLCREVLDKYYHSALPPIASEHLRRVQLTMIRKIAMSTTNEDFQLLQSQLMTWRAITLDGLGDKIKGAQADAYRAAASKNITERLTRGIKKHLLVNPNLDAEIENSMSAIVIQTFDLLNYMPYESRVILVEYSVPKDPFDASTMKICSSPIPPLGISLAENEVMLGKQPSAGSPFHAQGGDQTAPDSVGNNHNNHGRSSPSSSPVPTSPQPVVDNQQGEGEKTVRFAVDLCVRILGRDVLHKMAVYI